MTLVLPEPISTQSKTETFEDFSTCKDALIWDQFRAGNQEAFDYIYTRHFTSLFRFCLRFSNNSGVVQDCIQDLFVTLHKNRKNLGPTQSIKAYLFLSVKRKLVRCLNKEKRFSHVGFREQKIQDGLDSEKPFEFNIISDQMEKLNRSTLEKAFKKLPQNQRKALILFYYEDYSYREVAEFMGMTNIKSARNLMYKAINNLRKSF